MDITKVLQKHIRDISIDQEANLHREIDTFISQNQNLSDVELFDKIYSEYGNRIKFLEDSTKCKAILKIKGWVSCFGFFFILGLMIGFAYFMITIIKAS